MWTVFDILIPVYGAGPDPSIFRYDNKRTGESGLVSDITDPEPRWTFETDAASGGTPMAGDINNDGEMEIVWGSSDGVLYALDQDGNDIWTFQASGALLAPPGIADVDGDGLNEVVFGGFYFKTGDPNLYAVNGEDGTLIWTFSTEGMGSAREKGFEASPSFYDINDDGAMDVLIGSRNYYFYALDGTDGTIIWSSQFKHFIRSSSPMGDINGDGVDEILAVDNHGIVRLFDMNGNAHWEIDIGHGVAATPIFADLNGNGNDEIIFFSYGWAYWNILGIAQVYRCDGQLMWKNEEHQYFYSTPALYDVDGDTLPDIINVDSNDQVLIAYKGTTGDVIYTREPFEKNFMGPGLVTADIDGDKETEVLVVGPPNLYSINAADGSVDWVYETGSMRVGGPLVVDLDDDGLAEIIIKVDGNLVCLQNKFDPFALLDKIIEYILGLPDECFKNNADNRKNALVNKLESIRDMMLNGDYQGALNKLEKDIRSKMDGEGEDWITCEGAQDDLKKMIDKLADWLEDQL
jgi:outer membrane protein assembly factor BamB